MVYFWFLCIKKKLSFSEENTVKNDYMLMMHAYVDKKYQNIAYSHEDLKLFLTLKY